MGAFEDRLAEGYARQGSMTDQTPKARLAAALAAYERQADPDYVDEAMAEGVFAADPTLAADLALAAAVRRLEGVRASAIQRCSNGRWRVYLYDMDPEVPRDGWHTAQAAWDLIAAIEEALRDD